MVVTRRSASDLRQGLPAPSYDELKVPAYALPDVLALRSGRRVETSQEWLTELRPEVLELFRRYVYGRMDVDVSVQVERVSGPEPFAAGLGLLSELDVTLVPNGAASGKAPLIIRVLRHVPAQQREPAPVFLSLNLFGNHALHPDPRIRLASGWVPEHLDLGFVGNQATESGRGLQSGRWPVEMLLARGFALVTAYAGDIDPDFDDGFQNGLHRLLPDHAVARSDDAGGTIAAWAFGLSRLLDAIERDPELDAKRVIVVGHSRLGKAALWAAAEDTRFACAISNQSGAAGAALSRRCFGETLLHLNQRFPHWFCRAFHQFNGREQELPIDQHQLLALLAPRPVYVASAAADLWADPRGEELACQAASPVYALFGLEGVPTGSDEAPPYGSRGGHVGYHIRPGRHDITPRDFWHYMDFAERHLRARVEPR